VRLSVLGPRGTALEGLRAIPAAPAGERGGAEGDPLLTPFSDAVRGSPRRAAAPRRRPVLHARRAAS